ncbi:uroporphyrinogen-III synthase [Colwellia echini]|uniref:Uroporphyrinogen-III synthase n=2 Tax=Colwellia echini TaxID=1982103 RepID=A0ABY3MV23_9GAMM|nr:uroporphyrinogen-III synthase [Colwellia echini]
MLDARAGEPLKVLITRPKAKAEQLAILLANNGINSVSQTLFDYQANACANAISQAIENAETLIFVSAAAVEFANASYPLINSLLTSQQVDDSEFNNSNDEPDSETKTTPKITLKITPKTIFAVGNATKQALLALGISNIISPPAEQEHSEGLLKLPQLANVINDKILIIRGNGGREHIANTLRQRGANVNYIESYQRVWRTLPINTAKQWRAQQINCIVVTSNDILLALYKYLVSATDPTDNYWQSQCLWVVISERIEKNAKELGLAQVINTGSANSQVLCNKLQTLS